jgi:hypothetical protein
MPAARRTAAALVLALVSAGCTGDRERRDAEPAPRRVFTEVFGTVDLDGAVDADARLYDLAALPDDGSVALLGTGTGSTESYLVEVTAGGSEPGVGEVRRIPAVEQGADLLVTPDGAVHVVGTTEATGELQLVTLPADGRAPESASLGSSPDTVAAALFPDGRTLSVASSWDDGRPPQLTAVDLSTRAARATGTVDVGQPATVTHLTATPDGGLAALLAVDRGVQGAGVVLSRLDVDLRPTGEPLALVPPDAVGRPAGLQVTDDGTVVVSIGEAAPGPSRPQLLTVEHGRVRTAIDLRATEDSGLDLAVDPDGRYAYLPEAAYQVEPGVVTFDLSTGKRVGTVVLCIGAGSLGAVALAADGETLTATGVCLAGFRTTAFVVG